MSRAYLNLKSTQALGALTMTFFKICPNSRRPLESHPQTGAPRPATKPEAMFPFKVTLPANPVEVHNN
ncbi:hypothetical protein PCANC_28725, partial [Puccinia coronata f. sp. avenae]